MASDFIRRATQVGVSRFSEFAAHPTASPAVRILENAPPRLQKLTMQIIDESPARDMRH